MWVSTPFADLVRERFALLLEEHAFTIVEESAHEVVLESPGLRMRAALDPRGEVDVYVAQKGAHDWEGWRYSGMVGLASVDRLLELAREHLLEDPRILAGDETFFERLADKRRAESQALTAFAEGKGPRPGDRKLP